MLSDHDDFDKPGFLNIVLPSGADYGVQIERLGNTSPFFYMDDQDGAVTSFLRAVTDGSGDAVRFVSKRCSGNMDLSALRDVLTSNDYACLIPQRNPALNRRKTKALLLFDRENGERSVLFLRMIREPDQFGQWKIFSVEKE